MKLYTCSRVFIDEIPKVSAEFPDLKFLDFLRFFFLKPLGNLIFYNCQAYLDSGCGDGDDGDGAVSEVAALVRRRYHRLCSTASCVAALVAYNRPASPSFDHLVSEVCIRTNKYIRRPYTSVTILRKLRSGIIFLYLPPLPSHSLCICILILLKNKIKQ